MAERPEGLDDLPDHVADNMDAADPIHMFRVWHEGLARFTSPAVQVRRELIGDMIDEFDTVKARLDRFEKGLPSWGTGTPEEWDAWLRDLPSLPDDKRLEFYQWIGALAVREVVGGIRRTWDYEIGDGETANNIADGYDPDGPLAERYPSQLPLGKPFCDLDYHTHTHGGGRLPTCRLDSPE